MGRKGCFAAVACGLDHLKFVRLTGRSTGCLEYLNGWSIPKIDTLCEPRCSASCLTLAFLHRGLKPVFQVRKFSGVDGSG